MSKEIRINAFSMNCLGHLSPGLWTHPNDNSVRYNTLGYWTDLAKLLEAGLIDSLFLADVLGLYDVFRGGPETAIRHGTQTPNNDPLLVIPAMAAVTQNLGFAATAALSFEPPYTFARRMSTLDHLTGGRIGWNVVTGYLDSAARGAGREKQTSHDARYEIAHDYMDVVYKLWEGSWDDDAVVRNRATGAYADPQKVRRVQHRGPHYQIDAVHLSEPSPQRTPLLFQAGTSLKGREFAARHAECVFLNGRSKPIVAARVADIRSRAAAYGRDPADVRAFVELSLVVDRTESAARAKFEDYRRRASLEGALALLSGWLGIDFAAYGLDKPLTYVESDAIRSGIESLTVDSPDKKVWTARELAEMVTVGGPTPTLIGTPEAIVDTLEEWRRDTGVDGFNISYAITPGSFIDFIELVVPEMQRRGVYKHEYGEGVFREKLFGAGRARLSQPHPAVAFRAGRQGDAVRAASES
jgi:alkanesulfonate monooxygenase